MDVIINQLVEQFQLPLQNPVLIFSLILAIILLAPILLQRIRIPGIIGLIVSGIIIGPAGLNILEKSLFVDVRSEEHTSELQSRPHLVCRLLLEKKKKKKTKKYRKI